MANHWENSIQLIIYYNYCNIHTRPDDDFDDANIFKLILR